MKNNKLDYRQISDFPIGDAPFSSVISKSNIFHAVNDDLYLPENKTCPLVAYARHIGSVSPWRIRERNRLTFQISGLS